MENIKEFFRAGKINSLCIYLIPMILVFMLFIFKDRILHRNAQQAQEKIPVQEVMLLRDSLNDLYNYTGNGKKYQYTLIEFKSPKCSVCKRMDDEVAPLKDKYKQKINFQLYNTDKPENQIWMNYFGIVSIPVQIIFDREGREIFRNFGYIPGVELEKQFDSL